MTVYTSDSEKEKQTSFKGRVPLRRDVLWIAEGCHVQNV